MTRMMEDENTGTGEKKREKLSIILQEENISCPQSLLAFYGS